MDNSINLQPEIIKKLLKENGAFPNSGLFLLVYHRAFNLIDQGSADFIEKTFAFNNWKNSWRAGIFDYAHYHSNTHEVLGVYKGEAKMQFGGDNGIEIAIKEGDVIIIPAGVAHKCIVASPFFKCVGAYPDGMEYDIKKGNSSERIQSEKNIEAVPLPDFDPVYNEGPLQLNWEIQ